MSKNVKVFLGIAAIGAVLYYFSKAQAGKKLQVSFFGLKLGKIQGFNLNMEAKFRLLNGTNTPLTINSIIGKLFISGKELANINQVTPFAIAKNSDSIYTVLVQTSAFQVYNIIKDFIKNKQKFTVTFDGTINSEGFMIPVNQTILTL